MRMLQTGWVAAVAVLLLAAGVLGAAAALRGMEYDEAYTVFIAAGQPRPDWPAAPFRASEAAFAFAGHSTAAGIARDLRQTDVHPPLYFWAVAGWRGIAGTSLLSTRLLSVLFSLAALVLVGCIARAAAIPPATAMLLTLGCYGFSYTGHIARGFACAQMLSLAGVAVLLPASRLRRSGPALIAGLLLGAASFANYLAAFVGVAALLWLLLRHPGIWRVWLAAGIGFAMVLPADAVFFVAQRASRVDQFPPFHLLPGLARLATFAAAALFGGLPLYVDGAARIAVSVGLGLGLAALAGLIAWRWRRFSDPGARALLLMAAAAPPAGLILLGFVFNTTPIEMRYLAFATPFAALLIAGACGRAGLKGGRVVLGAVLAVQAAAIAGMLTRPETMQPQAQAARAASALAGPLGLVLVPHGNDGVGVVGPFVGSASADSRLLVVDAASIPAAALASDRVVVASLELDRASRQLVPALLQSFAQSACWRRAAVAFDAVAFDRRC